jgi:uncharacterized protein
VGPIDVPAAVSRVLRNALQALVSHTGLVGCGSVDFLLDGERPSLLEINPRPSATMDLYDDDWPGGLFEAHLQACRGRLPGPQIRRRTASVRAHGIVYANARLRISPEARFPTWCSDIPRPGSDLAVDAPICTVHADGADPSAALRLLGRRCRQAHLGLDGRRPELLGRNTRIEGEERQ